MTTGEVLAEIGRMNGTVESFPTNDLALANIAIEISRFVPDREKLTALIDYFIHHAGEWHGIRYLREIYEREFPTPALRFLPAPDDVAITSEEKAELKELKKTMKSKFPTIQYERKRLEEATRNFNSFDETKPVQ